MTALVTPYAEILALLDSLPVLVREKRRREGLSLRQAARDTGLSFSTICRCENGDDIVLTHARALLAWISS